MTKITTTPINNQVCWWNQTCAWLSIPKNANMMMRTVCEHEGYCKTAIASLPASFVSFAIIRNPRTRLFSGLGEFLKRKKIKPDLETALRYLRELEADPSAFDEHLEPQTFWISYSQTPCQLLKFENLRVDLQRFISEPTIARFIKPGMLETSRRMPSEITEQLDSCHSPLVDKILKKWYSDDCLLWQSIK